MRYRLTFTEGDPIELSLPWNISAERLTVCVDDLADHLGRELVSVERVPTRGHFEVELPDGRVIEAETDARARARAAKLGHPDAVPRRVS